MATARATVPTTGIGLVLNGVDVSGSLSISTPYGANLRKVQYNGLVPNTFYTGMISVTNSVGAVKQKAYRAYERLRKLLHAHAEVDLAGGAQ